MNTNKRILRGIVLLLLSLWFTGCARQTTPTTPPKAQLPASQTVSVVPQPSIDPALLDDGLDETLKDLDAVE